MSGSACPSDRQRTTEGRRSPRFKMSGFGCKRALLDAFCSCARGFTASSVRRFLSMWTSSEPNSFQCDPAEFQSTGTKTATTSGLPRRGSSPAASTWKTRMRSTTLSSKAPAQASSNNSKIDSPRLSFSLTVSCQHFANPIHQMKTSYRPHPPAPSEQQC